MKASVQRRSAVGVALLLLSACANNSSPPVQPTAEALAPPVVPASPPPRAPVASAPPSPPPDDDPGPPPDMPSDPVQLFSELSKMRPFNSQFINFDGISKFVSYYAAFSGREDVAKAAAGIRHDIQLLVRESFAMPTILLYNLTTTQFEAQLKNPMYARRAALGLFGIIQTSGMLYQQFIIEQQSRLSPDDLRGMQQQMTPGGPHTSNINTLNELQYDLKQKLGIK